jgi:hypothetical protein
MSLLYDASLIITPNAYKESKLYALKPQSGLGDMTVTRATTATRTNAAGLVELVPYNWFQYSEQFDNAAWGKVNASVTANNTTAPNGTLTADKLVENTATSPHATLQQATTIVGSLYTFSVYVKAAERTNVRVLIVNSPGTVELRVLANLTTGTFTSAVAGSPTSTSASMTSVGNGWYRISASMDAPTTGTQGHIYIANTAGSTNYTGDGTSGIYIWGAQLVQGSTPKDYFPTTDRLNVPRIDYSNGGCPSILVEPQRTNLLLRSEEFENLTTWTNIIGGTGVNPIRVANSAISPAGTQNADTITFNRGAGNTITDQSAINQQINIASAGNTTLSIWIKATNPSDIGKEVFIRCGNASNLQPEILAANWRRVFLVTNIAATGSNIFQIGNRGAITSNLSNSVSVDLWGAQVEVGAYPTSYIPTIASTVTRNADVISKTGISSLIGQTEGTIFVEFDNLLQTTYVSEYLISLYGDGVNQIWIRKESGTNTYTARVFASGSTAVTLINIPVLNGQNKIAFTYKSGESAVYLNGNQIATDSDSFTLAVPLTQLGLCNINGSTVGYAKISVAALWKTRLSNAELTALTTI